MKMKKFIRNPRDQTKFAASLETVFCSTANYCRCKNSIDLVIISVDSTRYMEPLRQISRVNQLCNFAY